MVETATEKCGVYIFYWYSSIEVDNLWHFQFHYNQALEKRIEKTSDEEVSCWFYYDVLIATAVWETNKIGSRHIYWNWSGERCNLMILLVFFLITAL